MTDMRGSKGHRRGWALGLTVALLAGAGVTVAAIQAHPSVVGIGTVDPIVADINLVEYPTVPVVGTSIEFVPAKGKSQTGSASVLAISDSQVLSTAATWANDQKQLETEFRIWATDRKTGEQVWAVAGDELGTPSEYGPNVGCEIQPDRATVFCIGGQDADSDSHDALITRLDSVTGRVLGQVEVSGVSDRSFQFLGDDLLVADEVTGPDADDDEYYRVGLTLRRVSPLTGEQRWSVPISVTEDYYGSDAASIDGDRLTVTVAAADPVDEWSTDTLFLDPATGKTLGRVAGDAYPWEDGTYFAPVDGKEYTGIGRSAADGSLLWSKPDVDLAWSPDLARHKVVLGTVGEFEYREGEYTPINEITLLAMDLTTGEKLWEKTTSSGSRWASTAGDLVLLDDSFVEIGTGQAVGSSYGRLVGVSPSLIYTSEDKVLRALNRVDLSVAWMVDLKTYYPDAENPGYVSVVGEHLVLNNQNEIRVLDPQLVSGEL